MTNNVAILIVVGVLGCLSVATMFLILLNAILDKQTEKMADLVGSIGPVVQSPDTIVKYVRDDDKTEKMLTMTPRSIVADWAAEQESLGVKISDEEIKDQVSMWAQNEEYL